MAREIVTYVPVVNGKDSGHFRSFKNAFFDFVGRTEKLRDQGAALSLECRSTQAPTMTLDFERVYALGEKTHLLKDGKVNFAAPEPSETMVNDAFAHAADKAA
ncbi:MAG: hypothetical protein WAX57_01330 [Minisyncoccia bacterium]